MGTTKDFGKEIAAKLQADPALRAAVERELLNSELAAMIYEARTRAGLTQAELGIRTGLHQSGIARMEDAEYGGRTLSSLWRIANALDCRLRIELTPRAAEIDEEVVVEEPRIDDNQRQPISSRDPK